MDFFDVVIIVFLFVVGTMIYAITWWNWHLKIMEEAKERAAWWVHSNPLKAAEILLEAADMKQPWPCVMWGWVVRKLRGAKDYEVE